MSLEETRWDQIKGSVLRPLVGGQSSGMRDVVSAAGSPLRPASRDGASTSRKSV